MIDKLIDKVSESMYQHKASEEVKKIMESEQGQAYVQSLVNGLLVRNYIVNMRVMGKISDEEVDRLITISSSAEGLTQLAAHMVLSGVTAAQPFKGMNMIQPENVYHKGHLKKQTITPKK